MLNFGGELVAIMLYMLVHNGVVRHRATLINILWLLFSKNLYVFTSFGFYHICLHLLSNQPAFGCSTIFIKVLKLPKWYQGWSLTRPDVDISKQKPPESSAPLSLSSYDWQVYSPVLSSTQSPFHPVKYWTANPSLYLEYFQIVSWLFMDLKRLTAYYYQVDHPETHRSILSWLMIV